MQHNSEHRQASRTALGTAYMRAAHQLLDAPPHILEDPYALRILGPEAEQRIRDGVERYQNPLYTLLRTHVALRSRVAEDRLQAAVARGVKQYVILGAGFDTFALRQPAWATTLRILEVDHTGTQSMKRAMLQAAGLALPPNAGFATIDFSRESLREGLARYELALDQPTFFAWLGVTMYLEQEAVEATLRSVAAFPEGSEIVLTFAAPPGDSPSQIEQHAVELGEPWLTYFEPPQLEALLRHVGFSRIHFVTPEEVAADYFNHRPADLPVPTHIRVVCARR